MLELRRMHAVALSALIASPCVATAQLAIEIELPSATDSAVQPEDLNNAGVAVGCIYDAASRRQAFRWERSTGTVLLSIPGAASSCALAVNDAGQIVGQADGDSGSFAFLWEDGRVTDLGAGYAPFINAAGIVAGEIPGAPDAWMWSASGGRVALAYGGRAVSPAGIDAVGRVVANTFDVPPPYYAGFFGAPVVYELQGGVAVPTPLDVSAASARANAMNARGDVAGIANIGLELAVIWTGSTMTSLGTLGGASSSVSAYRGTLNDAGEITGSSGTVDGLSHAFLWRDGYMIDLGTFGASFSDGVAVNNLGQVAGFALTTDYLTHAFLWSEGVMTDIGRPHEDSWARALNDRGEVLVTCNDGGPVRRAYVWFPSVPPDAAVGALADVVDSLSAAGATSGVVAALRASLAAAADRVAKGNVCAAARILDAFVRQVKAFETSGKLASADADRIMYLAQQALEVVASGCS
jgi:probable HAF family extracellular repeat protein